MPKILNKPDIPEGLTVAESVRLMFRLLSVGSKGFLTRKVDRSVRGLTARQPCCGPLQLTVADVGVIAQSHFGLTGGATSIGEQPIAMLVNEIAGARMGLAEAITNLAAALIDGDLECAKCSLNWMWPLKFEGEGAALWDAVRVTDLMKELGIAIDGGKDSVSMAAKLLEEWIKAPGEMVVSMYAPVKNVMKVLTPDIKKPGKTRLVWIDLARGKHRLGGSAFLQSLTQIGNEPPDIDDAQLLANGFRTVQKLIAENLILSIHDTTGDGGLVTTITEMAMSGNCGLKVSLPRQADKWHMLFAQEAGWVAEYTPENEEAICSLLENLDIPFALIGKTKKKRRVAIRFEDGETLLSEKTATLLEWWEALSDRLEEEQMNLKLAREQAKTHNRPHPIEYRLTFESKATPLELTERDRSKKPRVAIVREEGSNSHKEMASMFEQAGFEAWDVTMTDLLNGMEIIEDILGSGENMLDLFRGIVFVGGFSYADVPKSGRGWAAKIHFNPSLREKFERFLYQRLDTFSYWECNGCQTGAILGLAPFENAPEEDRVEFSQNFSERFESRWVATRIPEGTPAIMFREMEGSILPIWIDHGEGRVTCQNPEIIARACEQGLVPIVYVDDNGEPTEKYPFNPNGSPHGIAGFCSPNGRHVIMMPHISRVFSLFQMKGGYIPEWMEELEASPWIRPAQTLEQWCEETKHLAIVAS